MTLTAAEVRRVKRETMDARNRDEGAWRRAWAWVDATGARVTVQERPEGLLYTVTLRPFHQQWAQTLPDAVLAMRGNVEPFLRSGAQKGPTDSRVTPTTVARMARLREALGGG